MRTGVTRLDGRTGESQRESQETTPNSSEELRQITLNVTGRSLFVAVDSVLENWRPYTQMVLAKREYVTLKHDGRAIQALVVFPKVKNKASVVILVHEIFGLSDWAKKMAD
jgi:hypothetical protein